MIAFILFRTISNFWWYFIVVVLLMDHNRKNQRICDEVLIAIRRVIQSIDQHSKHLVKQFGLTGPQLITLVEITASGNHILETAPPLMQESFIEQFLELQTWEQHMLLSSLHRLVAMMDAKQIIVAPLLTTGVIDTQLEEPKAR